MNIVQLIIGQRQPFPSKQTFSTNDDHHRKYKRPNEPECASFNIIDSNGMKICGFINNRNRIIPITVKTGEETITFSCFDEIFLFLYDENEVYHTRFYCCRNWEIKTLKAIEIYNNNEINIPVEIKNLREHKNMNYHYNLNHSIAPNKYIVNFESKRIVLTSFQCPICFRISSEIENLRKHMEIHLRYQIEIDKNQIKIKKNLHETIKEDEIVGIDFCDDLIVKDQDESDYIGFYTDEDSEAQAFLENNQIETTNFNKMQIRVDNPAELVKWKNKAKDERISIIEMRQKPLIKKTIKKEANFKPLTIIKMMNKPIGTHFLREQTNKISYIRNNKNKTILDYKLKKYNLLIEREYDEFDYSEMIAKQINIEIKEKSELYKISKEECKIMEKWNESILKEGNVKNALISLINQNGINRKITDLIELFYTRGILNSGEIMEILDEVED